MKPTKTEFSHDRTEGERRKNLTDKHVKELELAGGAEGGMQAGSAGGPGQEDAERASRKAALQPDEANPHRSR